MVRYDRIDQDRTRQRICHFFVNYMLVDFKLLFRISFDRSSNIFNSKYSLQYSMCSKFMRGSILRFFLILKVRKNCDENFSRQIWSRFVSPISSLEWITTTKSILSDNFEPSFQAEAQLVSQNCTTDRDLFSVSCSDVKFDVRLKEGCLLSDASHQYLRPDFTEAFYISRQGYQNLLRS